MLLGLILLLIALAGCILFAVRPVWFPAAITAEALQYDHQFTWTLWIAGVIFVAAQFLLAWAIFRGSRRRSASFVTGNRRLELARLGATAVLFISLSVVGSRGWAKVPAPAPGKEIIEVHAHQFAWSFRYPGPDGHFGRAAIEFIRDAGGNPVGIDPKDPAGKDDFVTATLRIP